LHKMAELSAKKKAKKEKKLNAESPKAVKNPPTGEQMQNGHNESTPLSVKKKKKYHLTNGQDSMEEESNKENSFSNSVSESLVDDGTELSVIKKARIEQQDNLEDSSVSIIADEEKQRRKEEKLRRQQEKREKRLKRKEARAALQNGGGGKPLMGAAAGESPAAAKVSIVRTARKRMQVYFIILCILKK
jgi:hypothetical protein